MYQLMDPPTAVRRLADGALIPADPDNTDWQAYLLWLGGGHVPEPSPPVAVIVPASVTMRQARLALLSAGLYEQVEAVMAALPQPQRTAALIEWEYSNEVLRHNGFVSQIGPALGLSAEQLDALFVQASTL